MGRQDTDPGDPGDRDAGQAGQRHLEGVGAGGADEPAVVLGAQEPVGLGPRQLVADLLVGGRLAERVYRTRRSGSASSGSIDRTFIPTRSGLLPSLLECAVGLGA